MATNNLLVKAFAGVSGNTSKDDQHWLSRRSSRLLCPIQIVVDPVLIVLHIVTIPDYLFIPRLVWGGYPKTSASQNSQHDTKKYPIHHLVNHC